MSKTIYDVARQAGVGIATVSRVINNTGPVSDKTRAKVQAALTGYYPKSAAQALTAQKTNTIGLTISHDPAYFFINSTYINAMLGISDVTKAKGYKILLDMNNNEEETMELFYKKKVDGLLLMGTRQNSTIVPRLLKEKLPFVLIGDYLKPTKEKFCKIDIDDIAMAKEAVNHLITLGHRKIGYIGGSLEHPSCSNRLKGYFSALEEAGIEKNPDYIAISDSLTDDRAYNLAKKLLYQNNKVTAILAFNDIVAVAVYRAARELDILVPDDLSVIGFDDSVLAKNVYPPLTTVWQPSYEKGYEAASRLIHAIEDPSAEIDSLCMQSMLVFRDSCSRFFEK